MKAFWKPFMCLVLLAMILVSSGISQENALAVSSVPTITIISVTRDASVTIRTANFPAGDTFNVLMGKFGTRAVGGVKVASINSGNGGSFEATFSIPDSLKGLSQIAIRLESPASGYYSYNWFFNNTTGDEQSDNPPAFTPLPPGEYPTISIMSVTRDKNVTIRTANLPANDEFNVRMGVMGTRAVNGILVTKIASGEGGSQDLTFKIPSELNGAYQIAIRLESPISGYYSFNWFYNNTTTLPSDDTSDGSTVTPLPAGVIPTFSIIKVERNSTVTIKTANFPANDTFKVRMGPMGTRGINGYLVASINSGSGGVLELTFSIPAQLVNSYQIAIRLESSLSGYYSYNWFYNNTYP